MNTLLKRFSGIFFAAMLTITLFCVSANATTPMIYDFVSFTGSETVSVDLHGDCTKFAGLADENGEINSKNYTVSGDEQKTTVTLSEEYLNSLENGEYNFKGYFENALLTYNFIAAEDAGILIPTSKNSEFVNLTLGETEVENSNYVAEKTSDGFLVTVNKEFLQTLPENTEFSAHYYGDYMCYINLKVEKQNAQPTSATEPTKPAKTGNEQPSVFYPKTGVNNYVPQITLVMLLSACVLTLGILIGKYKNKENN